MEGMEALAGFDSSYDDHNILYSNSLEFPKPAWPCPETRPGLAGYKSNSLEFPKPAGPCPETRLAGYKPKGAINQTFPSPLQCSHDAALPDGAASPRRRRLRAGQWELFIFFARPARSALLISGKLKGVIQRPFRSNVATMLLGREKSLYNAFRLISCQPRLGTLPGGLEKLQAVATHTL